VLQTTNGQQSFILNSTGAFTVDLGTAGPIVNGRDIAAVFASTYVHWYAITTGLGSTTPAGIVSTATPPTGPVMPTSYSAWTYLGGSIYTSASTTIASDHNFRGAWGFYNVRQVTVTNGNTTAENTVSLALVAPPNHLESQHTVQTHLRQDNGQTFALRVVSGSNFHITSTVASAINAIVTFTERLPNINNNFIWLLSSAGASALDGVQMSFQGYKMPNGDV